MPGPYELPEQKNSVEVVRHNHEGIQGNMRKMKWNSIPTGRNNVRGRVVNHLAIHNLTKRHWRFRVQIVMK